VRPSARYASARTVYWIVDNGSSHAGNTSIRRMQKKWENARLIHLPVHASWLNQIELYFSILQRKALTPNDLATLDDLAARLLSFGEHYRPIARPFEWTFTRQDLDAPLARIATSAAQSSRQRKYSTALHLPIAVAVASHRRARSWLLRTRWGSVVASAWLPSAPENRQSSSLRFSQITTGCADRIRPLRR
jgi:DDE superfamily endonuclease